MASASAVVAGPWRTPGARVCGGKACMQEEGGRQAGRRLRAERRGAHAPLSAAAAATLPRGGWWWVARRQAAQHSAPNDWHGFFFFCRPRFPRLRAVLAVARTARACLPRSGVLLRSGEARGSVLGSK